MVTLRGLLILALVLFGAMFILPFFLGFIAFVLCSFALYIMLAKLGILRATTFKQTDAESPGQVRRESSVNADSEWDDEMQEAEVITLPETALRKSDEPKIDESAD